MAILHTILYLLAVLSSSSFLIAESQWIGARAVVYGNPSGSNTYGACYGGLPSSKVLGSRTASASAILFSNGTLNDCGACYQVRCVKSKNCKTSSPVTVTVTNVCYDGENSTNAQCSYPKKQLSLSQPAFSAIASIKKVGAVSVEIRRVSCVRSGSIQVYIYGNPYYIVFSISNVAGGGALSRVWVKGNSGKWIPAKLSWGVQWYVANSPALKGKSLSFRLQDKLTGATRTVNGVAPSNWNFNATYTPGQAGVPSPPPRNVPTPPPKSASPPSAPVPPSAPSPPSTWIRNASASFTGNKEGSDNFGACYGNATQASILGNYIAAGSSVFFAGASSTECGACYEIKCDSTSQFCIKSHKPIIVTLGNRCVGYNNSKYDRCGSNRAHFVLTQPAYKNLAPLASGAIPIEYRRAACPRAGTIKYRIGGNRYWIVVTILNVGGPGSLAAVSIKGSNTNWIPLRNTWGAYWRASNEPELYGQALSFRLYSRLSNLTLTVSNVAPANWTFNQTYSGGQFTSLY